jgi:methyltransferase
MSLEFNSDITPSLQGGYDLLIGTSEHGRKGSASELKLHPHKHILLAFGGPLGLEDAFSQDKTTNERSPAQVFDFYINTCEGQGSRTIRTEEAILISLAYLQPALALESSSSA